MTGFRYGILIAALVVVAVRAERIIAEGDTWRYFKGTSMPSPGSTWTTNGFDDSGWLVGPSGFGFGDGDDATLLSDMTNSIGGYVTVFTRKTFVIPDTNAVTTLTMGADYDDGFIAYLNGTEIASRTNNNVHPISNTTVATGSHEASRGDTSPLPKEFISVSPSLLKNGTNTLAVVGNNVSTNSSDFSLIIDLTTTGPLTRGPYLQMPNDNQVTFVWRTGSTSDSVVDFGLTESYSSGTSNLATLVTEHVVNITGLIPGTNYYYRVRSGGITLATDSFKTKPAVNQSYRFAIIGDFGSGTAGMSNIATRVNNTDFDVLLTVGDNIYPSGDPNDYDPKWFSQYWRTMRRVPTFPALGNHDVNGGAYNAQAYLDNFHLPTNGPAGQIERNYSYDYGNAHFTVVDSNPFAEGNTALYATIRTWLSNDLAATSKPWKFVYFHHPPRTSDGGSAHADNESVKTNLMPIVEAAGVQIVFDGHNHFYERINAVNGTYHYISGASGQVLYSPSNRKTYSATLNSTINSFTLGEMNGTRLTLRQLDATGAQIDEFNLDVGHPFKIDGLLDDAAWLRADNGLKLYAAIRGMYLYVATQDAGEGGDNFVYINNVVSTNRAPNWAKVGQVMQWNCFLADENDNAFQGWFGSTDTLRTEFPYFQSMTSGLNNNGTAGNGVLEGTVDLTNRFGAFPQKLYLAAGAFGNTNGASLTAFVPAAGNGNGVLTNFLVVNARDIALDLPVAVAGNTTSVLVNTAITLNGAASTAPSGLPLTFSWAKSSGPAGTFVSPATATPIYTPGAFTGSSSNALFALAVNDTRFDSNTNTVLVVVKNDSDGDGLTDDEETTGVDEFLTAANPAGNITDPFNADTDGDGASDGEEALAGTND